MEVMIAIVVGTVATYILSTSVTAAVANTISRQQQAVAAEGAMNCMEQIRSMPVESVFALFNDDPTKNKASAQRYFDDRLAYCLAMLKEYAMAFRQIRASGKTSLETYTSGM